MLTVRLKKKLIAISWPQQSNRQNVSSDEMQEYAKHPPRVHPSPYKFASFAHLLKLSTAFSLTETPILLHLVLFLLPTMKRDLQFPAGFRFHPTDEELVTHYLVLKCASQPIAASIVAEIDLYKFDPWDLPDRALYGEKEWYFFSPRDRKYPNGSRPNRAAGSGYWKATGADKPIGKPRPVGIKKALVFYAGKAPKGDKTNWIMHEYRLADVDRSARKKSGLRLDDWVLCRIYNKKGFVEKRRQQLSPSSTFLPVKAEEEKPQPLLLDSGYFPPALALQHTTSPSYDYIHFDTSESVPKLNPDSSCSEHTASPEFMSEVQSEPVWKSDYWEKFYGLAGGYGEANPDIGDCVDEMLPSQQDIFMYLQEPF